jgi:hypothetical protein
MERSNRDYGLCLQGEKGWKEMFRHVVVDIAARYVEVEVSGFKCDKVEYDTVVVEMFLPPVYTRMIRVAAKGPCEFDCAGKVARAMRTFLLGQRGELERIGEVALVEDQEVARAMREFLLGWQGMVEETEKAA